VVQDFQVERQVIVPETDDYDLQRLFIYHVLLPITNVLLFKAVASQESLFAVNGSQAT
jgi:hypothetical protein